MQCIARGEGAQESGGREAGCHRRHQVRGGRQEGGGGGGGEGGGGGGQHLIQGSADLLEPEGLVQEEEVEDIKEI